MNAKRDLTAERECARDAKALERGALGRLTPASRRLLDEAESQARARDDDHVGTEHIVLGLYALGQSPSKTALESLGITGVLFSSQLHDEPGPSPSGRIPLTPRARTIIGLAGAEASRLGSELVEPEHILLGVFRESQRWEATGMPGPHHLRAAADAAGTILSSVEERLIHLMRGSNDQNR